MSLKLARSIESRYGVDDPEYQPPARDTDAIALAQSEWGDTLSLWEAALAVMFPIAGFVLAIWRFGRGNVGPGIADMTLACIGTAIGLLLLLL